MKNVLIVDDSFFVRRILGNIVEELSDFTVVDSVQNGKLALESLEENDVDVMLLDLEMPKMDGVETLQAMEDREIRIPVIVITSHGNENAELGAKALEFGVVKMIQKPRSDDTGTPNIEPIRGSLHESLLNLFEEKISESRKSQASQTVSEGIHEQINFEPRLVVVGGSTGAPSHLRTLLRELPEDFPVPIVVVQHISEPFLTGLAETLNHKTNLTVRGVADTMTLEAGHVYLPGEEKHLVLRPGEENYAVRTDGEDPVNSACPSIDVLFESTAEVTDGEVVAVLYTGMGKDGAQGMEQLHDQGALCLAQNRETSTVYGMPAQAEKLGAVDYSFSPEELPEILNKIAERVNT